MVATLVVVDTVLTIPRARSAKRSTDTLIHAQGMLLALAEIAVDSAGTDAEELSGEGVDTLGARFGLV